MKQSFWCISAVRYQASWYCCWDTVHSHCQSKFSDTASAALCQNFDTISRVCKPSSLVLVIIMSSMTIPETFNVANADHILQDKDKAKYDSLKARMQNEQQEFLRKLRSKAFSDHTRYTGCHKQAADQIEVAPSPPHVATSC